MAAKAAGACSNATSMCSIAVIGDYDKGQESSAGHRACQFVLEFVIVAQLYRMGAGCRKLHWAGAYDGCMCFVQALIVQE